jgi:hypothetical protein
VPNVSGDSQLVPQPARLPTGRSAAARGKPTIRQRVLGMRLRELRNGVGLNVEEVDSGLLCSATKISRLETGAPRASLRDVRDLCRLYRMTDETHIAELMKPAGQSREPSWSSQYREPVLSPLLGSMYHVPAVLQTDDYARAIMRGMLELDIRWPSAEWAPLLGVNWTSGQNEDPTTFPRDESLPGPGLAILLADGTDLHGTGSLMT